MDLQDIPPSLCIQCKAARGLCGINPCPLLQRVRSHLPQSAPVGRDLFGSSPPTMFVGRHGYPDVTVGPMLPARHLEDGAARQLDDPRSWLDLSIPDVVGMRSSLVRTQHATSVHATDRLVQLTQELALAARPVDAEVRLDKAPRFGNPSIGEFTAPHGPVGRIERASLTENVRVERAVEALTSDTDATAATAMWEMYRRDVDPYQLERIMSAGMVGQAANRRLVPTRWAITATDDTLGKPLIDGVHDLPSIDKPTIHSATHFGNRFHILLLPGPWGFELVEAWLQGAFWVAGRQLEDIRPAVDWEDHRGRTTYARNTTGGYYATRLPVLEHLHAIRRRATAIVLREITDDYTTPLGVWVVREACRRALQTKGLVFEDVTAAMCHIDRHARLPDWHRHTRLLPRLRQQRRIEDF